MPVYTIDFNSATPAQLDPVDGTPYRPVENFFLASGADVLSLGNAQYDLGGTEYIFVNGTYDISILTREPVYGVENQSFKVTSIDLNGFTWANFEPTGAEVTFKFTAIPKANPGQRLYATYTTDAETGFETVILADLVVTDINGVPLVDYTGPGFDQSLYALTWVVVDNDAVFAAYDDIVVSTNSAPENLAFGDGVTTAEGALGQDFAKQLVALDAEDDRLFFNVLQVLVDGQDVTATAADLGIFIDGAGVLHVVAQDGDAELDQDRVIQVTYDVTDLEGESAPRTVTVTQASVVPEGLDLRDLGTNKADHVVGAGGADTLYGDSQSDTLEGRGGNDLLHGDNGEDRLYGENGHDRLEGGNGRDTLWGGAGDDTLYGENSPDRLDGGLGDDVLWGGGSADEFIFRFDGGDDVVMDFDVKTDRMFFDISMFGEDASFAALKASGRLEAVSGGVVMHYDGADGQDHTITLMGVSLNSLKAANFDFSMPGDIFG